MGFKEFALPGAALEINLPPSAVLDGGRLPSAVLD